MFHVKHILSSKIQLYYRFFYGDNFFCLIFDTSGVHNNVGVLVKVCLIRYNPSRDHWSFEGN